MNTQALKNLKEDISGNVLLRDSDGYHEARQIWNGMFDRYPLIIIQPRNTTDVINAVNFAREQELLLAVKGGGHHSAGTSACDDGLMIDLSHMNAVSVNTDDNTVIVQGGCLLGDVDAETTKYGLAVSAGIISHTGVGGLTLGGGFGWISRKHGLSVDNLIEAEVVTAKGEAVKASANENEDLFWAIRGGGGNFGIVTEFKFRAAEIGSEVFSGPIIKSIENADEYIRFHREYVRTLPDEMTVWMVIRHAPPLPFLTPDVHGKLVIVVPFVWLGDQVEGQELIQPILDTTETLGSGAAMHPWAAWQQGFDGLVPHGARNYWKSHHLKSLSDDCISELIKYGKTMPTDECEIFIPHMEGAPSRIDSASTAFPHRSTPFVLNIHTRWQKAEDDERCMTWARDFHKATEPYGQGVYVNFLSDIGDEKVKDAYTPDVLEKLSVIKGKWDPDNLFRMNQNIKPASKLAT